jgi:iron complex outermembrane recepter protein
MKLLFLISMLSFPLYVFPQTNTGNEFGTIKGKISTSDGEPAEFVSVMVKNSGVGTVTDADGNFEIKKIKAGFHHIHVSLQSYADTEITVAVKADVTSFLQVQLHLTYAALKHVIVQTNLHPNYVETKTSESLRLNLPLLEVPQNIVVSTQQLFADQGLTNMTQAIRTVSGVEKFDGDFSDYSLNIRGTEATGNVFRNGVGGYLWNQQEDIAMLEKIEFIKGPAGFMISLAEPGGVINNVTKQPVRENIANINAAFGSFNLMRLTSDFGGSFSKTSKFSYRFNGGVQYQDRFYQFSTAFKYFLCGVLTYDLNKKISITAEYNKTYGETKGRNGATPSIDGKYFTLPVDFTVADKNTDENTNTDNYYRVHATYNFNDNWHLNTQIAWVYGQIGGGGLWADATTPVSNDTMYRVLVLSDWRNSTNVAQAFLDGKFFTGRNFEHKILFGLDYCNSSSKDRGNAQGYGEKKFGLYTPDPDYYVNPDSMKISPSDVATKLSFHWLTLYAQDNMKIAGKLIITLAGHLTHAVVESENNGAPDYQEKNLYNVFSPRAGVTWLFSNTVSAYVLYDESFYPQIGPNFERKQFDPMTGHDIEAGMKGYFFKKNLALNFSVYDIVKNNTLTADPLHDGYYIQTGQITSKGIDMDITGNITNALTVNANYEFCDAKITKDNDPKTVGIKNYGVPDHTCNLWLKYKLLHCRLKGVSFAMGYQYMGKRNAAGDENIFMPVYNLLDAALGYSNGRCTVGLNLYNITDVTYMTIGHFNTDTNAWTYRPGEPINFMLSFGYNLSGKNKIKFHS